MQSHSKNSQKILRSFGAHDGTFHADEVSACALLLLFERIDRDKIVRTRDTKRLFTCEYVCDVGGIYDPSRKLFDHHQAEYKGEWSSAGMVLKYLWDEADITQEEYDFFRRMLIKGIDDHDNGRAPLVEGYCSFSNVISNFTPIEYEVSAGEQDECFFKAVDFVHWYLKRLLERHRYNRSCAEMVAERMRNSDTCMVFEESIPWLESFFALGGETHSALFVIMPSGSHWKLRGIPPTYENRMSVRLPLPSEWAGLLEEDLKRVSGIPGAVFCHKGRFISVWETKEDAEKALKYTLKHAETKR